MDLVAILQENEQLKINLDYLNILVKNTKMTLGSVIDENINLKTQVEMLQLRFQQQAEAQKKTEQPEEPKKDETEKPEELNESIKDDDLDADSVPV